MSTVLWAGISVDPMRSGTVEAHLINHRIDCALTRAANQTLSSVLGDDGSEIYRYMINDVIITDFHDRRGERVGIGIEAGDTDDAYSLLDDAYELLADVLGIIDKFDEVEVWIWDRTAVPHQPPNICR